MTSVGEGEVDGNPLHIHTLSSQINSPTSSSSSSFSDESTTDSGGEREEEYHNQIIYESIPAVGGFREGEINGKPFHIFNFLSQTETPSSSSSDFPPLYVCPSFRKSKKWRDLSPKNPNRSDFLPVDVFPRMFSHVCGLIKEHFPTYVCARCVVVVHKDCIYHPYVIRISPHHHRISFNSSLPSGRWSCGVCRRKVDNSYGAYSCNKCDGYFVHTKCALRKDLWDGKELDGVPEELEIVVEPFERISDGVILHFAHEHHLRFEISGANCDEEKSCQACILPIYEGSYYSCMDQCDFILHEACANAPRKKQHAMHAHALTLKVDNIGFWAGLGYFYCFACYRLSRGFVYEGPKDILGGFKLDLRCASVSEPFQYEGHEHPLFLALTPEEEKSSICQICQEEGDECNDWRKLTCIKCSYIICFRCATLPYKARYKHDDHLLVFRKKEEGNDHQGWCDICESEIVYSRKGGFYSCDDYCSTTVHVDCLLGKDPYMRPGQIKFNRLHEVLILHNKTMSRPFCHGKHHRCQDKLVFKKRNMTFCSLYCLNQ